MTADLLDKQLSFKNVMFSIVSLRFWRGVGRKV